MSIVNQLEIFPNGEIGVRIAKTISCHNIGWHRFSIYPGQDINEITKIIDDDLKTMGVDAVDDWKTVSTMITTIHTPDVIATYEKAQNATREVVA